MQCVTDRTDRGNERQTCEHLEGLAVGGEREEVGEGERDGEEAVDELDVLTADALGPRPGVDADELLDGEVEGDLLGLVEEADGGGGLPRPHGGEDEAVDAGEERRRRGAAEAGERERVEAAVRGAPGEEQRVRAEQRGDGGRVAAADGAALGGEEEAVEGRVGGEDGALAEDVGGEDAAAVARHAVVDEGLRVGGLVGGDEAQRLPDERQPRAARRQPRRPALRRPRGEEPSQRGGEQHSRGQEERQQRRRRPARVHGRGRVRFGYGGDWGVDGWISGGSACGCREVRLSERDAQRIFDSIRDGGCLWGVFQYL